MNAEEQHQKRAAEHLIATLRAAVAEEPSYVDRYRDGTVFETDHHIANFWCRGCGAWEYRPKRLMEKYCQRQRTAPLLDGNVV